MLTMHKHLPRYWCLHIFYVDPFAEANAEDSGAGAGSKNYVHVRVQQRNGRKSLTTVQGLKKEYSYNKILKDLKKEFCCNGTVVQDSELGQVQRICLSFWIKVL
jgi:translation initiation factor 1